MKQKKKNMLVCIASFGVSFLFMVLLCIIKKTWIFGDSTFLIGDASTQYVPLMNELWEKVHNGGSIFYSQHASMGFDFYTNAVYYLLSPFNIIVLLLPKVFLEDAIQFVAMLKWALCASTMTYYVLHTKRNRMVEARECIAFALGISYAFSRYLISVVECYIWFDVFLLFPLVVLSFERMMEKGCWKRYYLLLTLCMFCNFYTTFSMCIFLILLFFNQEMRSWKEWSRNALKFVLASVLSAITSLAVIFPCVMMSTQRYTGETTGLISMKECVSELSELVSGLFFFREITHVYRTEPCYYQGAFFVIVLVLSLFIKGNWKRKCKYMFTWILLFASFYIPLLNYIWHGCSVPHGFYQRFTYIYIFYVLYLLIEVLPQLHKVRVRYICIGSGICLLMLVYAFFQEKEYYDAYAYFVTIMVFVLYGIILVLYRRKSFSTRIFAYIVGIFTCVELFANAYVILDDYVQDDVFKSEEYVTIEKITEDIELGVGERIAFVKNNTNIGLLSGLQTIPGFLSFANGDFSNLAYKMGISGFKNDASVDYIGGSPITNILYNVRYGIASCGFSYSDMEEINVVDDSHLYRMKNLVGLGYMVDDGILEWSYQGQNVFECQNTFIEKTTGVDGVFTVLDNTGKCTTNYAEYEADEEGVYSYQVVGQGDAVCLEYKVPHDMDLYIYQDNKNLGVTVVLIDGEVVGRSDKNSTKQMFHIGEVKKEQVILMYDFLIATPAMKGTVSYQLAEFNEDRMNQAYDKLKKSIWNVDVCEDAKISGEINVEQDGIMMTSVQAMDGYSVYVDGEKAEYEEVLDNAFIAVPLKKGVHNVELRYRTPYIYAGIAGSCLGIFIFVIISVMEKSKHRMKKDSNLGE